MSFYKREVNRILYQIKQGDEDSKNKLFHFTYNHLKIVAGKYLTNKNNIEDVVVNAYLKVFKYISSFDGKKDGYNWLCKIVQNTAYDFNKKEINWLSLEEYVEPIKKDFSEAIIEEEVISKYLESYSKDIKELVYLRFWEGLSYKEIRIRTGLKKSTAHKRISKVLKEIFQKIKKQ